MCTPGIYFRSYIGIDVVSARPEGTLRSDAFHVSFEFLFARPSVNRMVLYRGLASCFKHSIKSSDGNV